MKELILVGASGCMRELAWEIEELNKIHPTWKIVGYVDRGEELDLVEVAGKQIPYLGDDDYLLSLEQEHNLAICVGEPHLRKKIADKLKNNPKLLFPNLILSNTMVCDDIQMGEGNIVSMGVKLSTNVKLGSFVFLNTEAMVCHDGRIGDFVTLSPRATLAGNVSVGELSEIGMTASVIQGITIGANAKIGAAAAVVRNLSDNVVAVGVPAKVIKEK